MKLDLDNMWQKVIRADRNTYKMSSLPQYSKKSRNSPDSWQISNKIHSIYHLPTIKRLLAEILVINIISQRIMFNWSYTKTEAALKISWLQAYNKSHILHISFFSWRILHTYLNRTETISCKSVQCPNFWDNIYLLTYLIIPTIVLIFWTPVDIYTNPD